MRMQVCRKLICKKVILLFLGFVFQGELVSSFRAPVTTRGSRTFREPISYQVSSPQHSSFAADLTPEQVNSLEVQDLVELAKARASGNRDLYAILLHKFKAKSALQGSLVEKQVNVPLFQRKQDIEDVVSPRLEPLDRVANQKIDLPRLESLSNIAKEQTPVLPQKSMAHLPSLPSLEVVAPSKKPALDKSILEEMRGSKAADKDQSIAAKEGPIRLVDTQTSANGSSAQVRVLFAKLLAPYTPGYLGALFNSTFNDVFEYIDSAIQENRIDSDYGIAVNSIVRLTQKLVNAAEQIDAEEKASFKKQRDELQKKYKHLLEQNKQYVFKLSRSLSQKKVYLEFFSHYKNLTREYVNFVHAFYSPTAKESRELDLIDAELIEEQLSSEACNDQLVCDADRLDLAKMPELLQAWSATEVALSELESQNDSLNAWIEAANKWARFEHTVAPKERKKNPIFYEQGRVASKCVVDGLRLYLDSKSKESNALKELKLAGALILSIYEWSALLKEVKLTIPAKILAINARKVEAMVSRLKRIILDRNDFEVAVPLPLLVEIAQARGAKSLRLLEGFISYKPVLDLFIPFNQAMFATMEQHNNFSSIVSEWEKLEKSLQKRDPAEPKDASHLIYFLNMAAKEKAKSSSGAVSSQYRAYLYMALPWFGSVAEAIRNTYKLDQIAAEFNKSRSFIERLLDEDDLQEKLLLSGASWSRSMFGERFGLTVKDEESFWEDVDNKVRVFDQAMHDFSEAILKYKCPAGLTGLTVAGSGYKNPPKIVNFNTAIGAWCTPMSAPLSKQKNPSGAFVNKASIDSVKNNLVLAAIDFQIYADKNKQSNKRLALLAQEMVYVIAALYLQFTQIYLELK